MNCVYDFMLGIIMVCLNNWNHISWLKMEYNQNNESIKSIATILWECIGNIGITYMGSNVHCCVI